MHACALLTEMGSLRVAGVLTAAACCLLVTSPAAAAVELTAENFKELVVTPEKNAFVLCVLDASCTLMRS